MLSVMLTMLKQLRKRLRGAPAHAQSRTAEMIARGRAELSWDEIFQLRSLLFDETMVREAKAVTPEGSFSFDIRDNVIGWSIAFGGWEPVETNWVKSVLSPGDLALDIGANIGWYTVVMANLVGSDGHVIAFEPEPRNFDLLIKNVAENDCLDRCTLLKTALLDKPGQCELEQSSENYGDHRVHVRAAEQFANNMYAEEKREKITVAVDTLDAAVSKAGYAGRPVRLLKVDSQGSEVSIFAGAEKTLANTDYVIAEYWPYGLERAGKTADQFYAAVKDHFREFARSDNRFCFEPMAKLRADMEIAANTPCGETVYVFKK